MNLKVLQSNIWFGGKKIENLEKFIQHHNPDILILQEVYEPRPDNDDPRYQFLTHLHQKGGYHINFAPNFFMSRSIVDDDVHTNWGTAILSKFPIVNSSNNFYLGSYDTFDLLTLGGDYSTLPRSLQHCEIDVNGEVVYVFTTHGIWGFDDQDNDQRLEMSSSILEGVEGYKNVIFAGDLNVDQNTQTIRNLEGKMTNVFKGKLQTTFNMKYKPTNKGSFAHSVVDFVFVSPEFEILSSTTSADEDISDHLALLCELGFGKD